MAILQLADPQGPDDEYQTTLQGAVFRLRWRWHERSGRWSLDLYDVDRDPIRLGMRPVVGVGLLAGYQHPLRPKGDIWIQTKGDTEPGRNDFGTNAIIYYLEGR